MQDNTQWMEFDFDSYIASLMEEMDMAEAPAEIQKDVTYQLGRQLSYRLVNALTMNFRDEDWTNLVNAQNTANLSDLLMDAIERNPEVKERVLEELSRFYDETLEAHYALR